MSSSELFEIFKNSFYFIFDRKPKADDVFSKATKKINSDLNASTD